MNEAAPCATSISLASRDSTEQLQFKLNRTPASFLPDLLCPRLSRSGRILVRSRPIRSDEPDAIHRRTPPPRRLLVLRLRLRVRSQGTQPFPSYEGFYSL
jgi:hypothetical protein